MEKLKGKSRTVKEFVGKTISSMNELNEFLNAEDVKEYIFRGEANSNWTLSSSHCRAWIEENENSKENWLPISFKLLISNNDFIGTCKKTHDIISPSPLIDFSNDIYIALFFMCFTEKGNNMLLENNSTLYLIKKSDFDNIDISHINNLTLNEEEWSKNKIYDFSNNDEVLARGLRQKSFFIIDNNIDILSGYNIKKISFDKKLKEDIFKIVSEKGINFRCLFGSPEGPLWDMNIKNFLGNRSKNEEKEENVKSKSRQKGSETKENLNENFKKKEFRNNWNINPKDYTSKTVVNFLWDNIFYAESHESIDKVVDIVLNRDWDLRLVSYWIIGSIYNFYDTKNKEIPSKLNELSSKLMNIWQNNELVLKLNEQNNDLLSSRFKKIFEDFERDFNDSDIFKIYDYNNEKLIVDFKDLFDVMLFVEDQPKNKLLNNEISSFVNIRDPYDENFSDNGIVEGNLTILNNIFKPADSTWGKSNSFDLRRKNNSIDSLIEWKDKIVGGKNNQFKLQIHRDLRKLNLDLWYYFNQEENRSIKDVVKESWDLYYHYYSLDEEKKSIIEVYYTLKNYLNLNLDPNSNGSISYGRSVGIEDYSNQEYLKYIGKVNELKFQFLNWILKPLINSLQIFSDSENLLDKNIGKYIYNHLLIIKHDLELNYFYIPSNFRDKDEYEKDIKNSFIYENILNRFTKWKQEDGNFSSGTSMFSYEEFEIDNNFIEKEWIDNVIEIIKDKKEELFADDIKFDYEVCKDPKIWDSKWEEMIINIMKRWEEIKTIVNSKESKEILDRLFSKT